MICAPRFWLSKAAAAICSGLVPSVCTARKPVSPDWSAFNKVRRCFCRAGFEATISETAKPAPNCLQRFRKGRSVAENQGNGAQRSDDF